MLQKLVILKSFSVGSCESLSKFCIFACFKNKFKLQYKTDCVVNRFQNFVSLHASKTKIVGEIRALKLWIAFKILYLCMLQKPLLKEVYWKKSCESLSKFCIFACFKNILALGIYGITVVNRFQNFVSLHASKTLGTNRNQSGKLWIAFKILYLCMLQKQWGFLNLNWYVVNRFQNFVSLHASKTDTGVGNEFSMLWIAFKILYLCMLQKPLM